MNIKKRPAIVDYAALAGLAILMALNYQVFILHNAFAPAGINGLATMAQYVFDFSIGYMSLIINVPLAIFAFFNVDKEFALKNLVFVLVFSGAMLILQNYVDLSRFIYHTGDGRSTLLAPVASGVVNGYIYGCAIRLGGSTGGTDFLAAYVHKRRPEYSLIKVLFAFNVSVALLSYFVYDFNIEPVILCIAYCYITTNVGDHMIKGGEKAIKVELITSYPEEISKALIEGLRHSVTIVDARGGYSGEEKSMLVCIINKHQIARMTEIIRRFPDTFACISDVNQTLGNFKRITKK